ARSADVPELPRKGLPAEDKLRSVIARALAPSRDARYPSAAAMQRDLDAYAASAKMMTSPLALGDWLKSTFGEDILDRRRARERATEALEMGAPLVVQAIAPGAQPAPPAVGPAAGGALTSPGAPSGRKRAALAVAPKRAIATAVVALVVLAAAILAVVLSGALRPRHAPLRSIAAGPDRARVHVLGARGPGAPGGGGRAGRVPLQRAATRRCDPGRARRRAAQGSQAARERPRRDAGRARRLARVPAGSRRVLLRADRRGDAPGAAAHRARDVARARGARPVRPRARRGRTKRAVGERDAGRGRGRLPARAAGGDPGARARRRGRAPREGRRALGQRAAREEAFFSEPAVRDAPHDATAAQSAAIEAIAGALREGRAATFLVHGVT